MIVDVHSHVVVPEILRDAAPGQAWRPRVLREDGGQVVEFAGKRIRSAVREFVDVGTILEQEGAAGIDLVLLSPWISLAFYDVPPREGLQRSRLQNDALAVAAARHPDRVRAVGTVPLQDPALAAAELERLMGLPGMHGVQVAASVRGVYLGDDRFAPFWEAAEALGATILIHPTTRGFDLPVFEEHYLWNTVGNPMETTVTAAHMVLNGVMERHPRLKVVLAHGGGAILAVRGRLEHGWRAVAAARGRLEASPVASIRRFHFDTVTHDPTLLRELVGFAGAERVLLGSDHPFDMGTERPVEAVRAAGLSPEEEALVLGGNAVRLLGLGAPAGTGG